MGIFQSYRLRTERRRYLIRAIGKRRELRRVSAPATPLQANGTLLFVTVRNERARLPWFLDYYRALGVRAFFCVDNASTDGSVEYLSSQSDVWLWQTQASYARSRFGADWLNWLKMRYAHDRWTLTVDADEFFVYPYCDSRPLDALTDWLDQCETRSFGTLLLDMYPEGPLADATCAEGQDPFEIACWFDSANYTYKANPSKKNLWIQGGPRARAYFADRPREAPSLNKIPLVRWNRRMVYASSTHMLLPRGLNRVYDDTGGEKASGCLLHAKFLSTLVGRAKEEAARQEHFAGAREYAAYGRAGRDHALWTPFSERYLGWRQLERLGLMSPGDWA